MYRLSDQATPMLPVFRDDANLGLEHRLIVIYDPMTEMEYCASAASMLAEEFWQIAEGFVEVPVNL